MKIIKVKNYEEMSKKAADILAAQVILKPDCVLGLATGSTPVGAYSKLGEWCKEGTLDFSLVKTCNLDEYCGLEVTNDQSYRYFMNKNLFSKINIKMENTNVPNGVIDGDKAAKEYEELIENYGGIDMQLLGIGHDGHIGFNEPSDAFDNETHVVELTEMTIEANSRFFNDKSEVPTKAITMGMKRIMQAKKILLIVSGKDKEEILKKALFGPITPQVPASILQLHADLTVVTDCEL